MSDPFDPYREALVMETETVWPDECSSWSEDERDEAAKQLHAEPDKASQLEYLRSHTGFTRRIIVTDADLARLGRN